MMRSLRQLLPELESDLSLSGWRIDAREIQPNEGFIALSGRQAHGLDYADEAIRRGAAVVLFEPTMAGRPAPKQLPPPHAMVVPNLSARLGEIGARFYDDPSHAMDVIGVTGTNGKTSFVQLLSGALAHLGRGAGSIGTLGAGLVGALQSQPRTTPDALSVQRALAALRADGAKTVAMEVSSHALDQDRVAGVRFHTAVFTNLTRDHLDYHGSMAAYGEAKAKLFAQPGLRHAIINVDDAFGAELAAQLGAQLDVWRVGFSGTADVQISALELLPSGLRLRLSGRLALQLQSQLIGEFNALNLAQVAVALHLSGVSNQDIELALAQLPPVNGRMNALSAAPMVVVDYAHTPDALEKALRATRSHTHGALWVVFGCGGDRDAGKRPQMARIAERLADRVCVTSDNPRSESPAQIVADVLQGFSRREAVQVELDRSLAIARTIAAAADRDAVLIAGKGHETWQEIGPEKIPFDDADHARRALERRPC
jgi:UDP-N-acetylmuramoyl-L-alanyl-D-glutamate--2,6-diaminopimelate ligase